MPENSPTPTSPNTPADTPVSRKERDPRILGWLTILVIFGFLGLWAALAQIETTVAASGKVISKGYKKVVQHPRGGIVTQLYVQEGDRVEKGAPLMQLDDVEIDSQLQSAIKQHDELLFQTARLEAEANLSHSPDFDRILPQIIDRKRGKRLLPREKALFESNMNKLKLTTEVLRSRNRILEEQNRGLEARIRSDRRQLSSYRKELAKWKKLYERNMTDELKVLERQRKIEDILASIAQEESKIRENNATMRGNESQIRLEEGDFVNKARKTLQESSIKLSTLTEQIRALRNAKLRMKITAPDSGTVTDMSIHSVGEVVPPHKPIAYIVPDDKRLVLELFVQPTDIDKIHKGQTAEIHFPSYVDPSAKPIEGRVTYLSADTVIPEGAKAPFYKILVEITPKGMEAIRENGFEIVPGMPATAFIKAGKRSFLSYILLPLEQLARGAFHAN